MKVLVTGGAGFIGSHVVEEHVNSGDQIIIVDDFSMGKWENIPKSGAVTVYEKSITDYKFIEKLLIEEKFDVIYLLAAIASVADTIERPFESHLVNQEANLVILETIRTNKLSVQRIIFASSAAVYGNLPKVPKEESDPVLPDTAYAIDKYATERFVLAYSHLYQIPTVAFRFFNVYGPRQNPKSPYSGVLSIAANALKNDSVFKVFGDGLQTRDFVYVKDVVQALQLGMRNDDMIGQVFNVATGHARSLNETLALLETAAQRHFKLEYLDPRVGDIKYSSAQIDKIQSYGYQPKFNLNRGLQQYWESLGE